MVNKGLSMLRGAVDTISTEESITNKEAYSKLLDWCAVKLGIEGVFSSMQGTTSQMMQNMIDLGALKDSPDDLFGDLYEEIFNVKIKSLEESLKVIESHNLQIVEGFPKSLLFNDVQTGRSLISTYKKYGESFILYGTEKDRLLYHIALVNIKLHDLPAFVINISKSEGKDFTAGSTNWRLSNMWNTPKTKLFK